MIRDATFPTLAATADEVEQIMAQCAGCSLHIQDWLITDAFDPAAVDGIISGILAQNPDVEYLIMPYSLGDTAVIESLRTAGRSDVKVLHKDPNDEGLTNVINGGAWLTAASSLEWPGLGRHRPGHPGPDRRAVPRCPGSRHRCAAVQTPTTHRATWTRTRGSPIPSTSVPSTGRSGASASSRRTAEVTATGRGSAEHQPVAGRFSGVTKVYGGTVALAEADFEVLAGEIHGLLGENGAGKSTLVKIAAGVEIPDAGTVELFGEVLPAGFGPEVVARRGCAFIHQQHGLVGALTIAENVALTAGFPTRGGSIDRNELRARARSALARMGVDLDVDTEVADLPIALPGPSGDRTGGGHGRPAAGAGRADRQPARRGPCATCSRSCGAFDPRAVAIVLITHRIDEVMGICDRVSVIRDGRTVATRDIEGLSESELVTLIVGREGGARGSRCACRGADGCADGAPPGGWWFRAALALSAGRGDGRGHGTGRLGSSHLGADALRFWSR